METLIPIPHHMPWNITLLLTLLCLQMFHCMFTIVIVALVHPMASSVYSTLDDINILLPEMNSTLYDVNILLPTIKHAASTIDSICDSVGCSRV